jgi:hypothetical protein
VVEVVAVLVVAPVVGAPIVTVVSTPFMVVCIKPAVGVVVVAEVVSLLRMNGLAATEAPRSKAAISERVTAMVKSVGISKSEDCKMSVDY